MSFPPSEAKASLTWLFFTSYHSAKMGAGAGWGGTGAHWNHLNLTRLCNRQNRAQLPMWWQFWRPKLIFWPPKAYITKCSIPVQFCKLFCYLDKRYSRPQWELSLNLQCGGLCSVSSNNLHNSINFQNASQVLYPQDHLWMEKTGNQKIECGPPAEIKEDSDNTDIWEWNPGFITQRSLAKGYIVTSIEVCVTLMSSHQGVGAGLEPFYTGVAKLQYSGLILKINA